MNRQEGFTLIEMLVATTMLVMLSAAGLAALSAGTRAASKSTRINTMLGRGQQAMQLITSDIRVALANGDFTMVSLDRETGGLDTDTLDFVTARTPRQVEEDVIPLGRCEVGYSIATSDDYDHPMLLRREDGALDEELLAGGPMVPIGPYIAEFNVEFYDGILWSSGWESKYGMPEAVSVSLVVLDEADVESPMVFSATVPILVQANETE